MATAIFFMSPPGVILLVWGPPTRKSCARLECVSQLQYSEVVAPPADDLNPDRQPVSRESGGHRNGRAERRADPVRRLHPRSVMLHRHACDFAGPGEHGVERRDLVHGAYEKTV